MDGIETALRKRVSWRLLPFILGLVLAVYLVMRMGPAALVSQVFSVGPGFLLMPVIFGVGMAIRAFGLWALLERDRRPAIRSIIASRFAASSLNDLLPVFGVGGEASRLLWFPAHHRSSTVPALILDRTLLIIADAIFVLTVSLVAIVQVTMPKKFQLQVIFASGVALAMGLGLVWFTKKRGFAVVVAKVATRFRVKDAHRWLEKAKKIDAAVRETWISHPRRLTINIFIQLGSRMLLAAETWIGLMLLRGDAKISTSFILAAIPMAVSVVFAMVPSQVGAQEGAMALTCAALQIDPGIGLALSVLQRIRQTILVPLGFFLLSAVSRKA